MPLPRPSNRARFDTGPVALAFLLLMLLGAITTPARAQFTYTEDFKNNTAPGWDTNFYNDQGVGPGIRLTSGAAPVSTDPEYGNSVIDPSGAGWLRLTTNTTNQANATFFATPIPSAGNKVTISFGFNAFAGGTTPGYPSGADGITFFLYDASQTFSPGAFGGSIGYAQKTGIDGLGGAYVGIALDAFGNFSQANEGRVGGVGFAPNSVAVRGPGSGQTGYDYLAGTTGSNGTVGYDYTDTGSPTTQQAGDGVVPALPYNMAFADATSRPNQTTQYRNVQVVLDENNQMAVSMQFGEDGLWYNILNVDLSSFARPDQLRFGYSAGTGSGTQVYEVGNLLSITATAGTGQFIWDNGNGNSKWGTGANDPINWAGNTNPTLKSNVIFNSSYVSTAQNIDLTGSDKVVKNLYFSGTNAYTLGTSESRKLIMDSETPGGLTTISVISDAGGSASHTIGVDVQMNQNLQVSNNIGSPFTISGNVDTGGNILETTGAGSTTFSGVISNTGSINKTGAGTTALSGSNTYTGGTTVTGGTLQITNANALGSTAAGTTVLSGATLALAGTGTTFVAEGLTINGDGAGSAGALRNTAGANTWTGTVALGTTGSNSIGVDSGSALTVSGIISGASGNNLTKTGAGTLTLSGTNTYAGSTTINQGTVAISADTNLGTAPGAATAGQLTLNGGTLENTASFTLNANRGIALGASGGTLQTDPGTTLTYNGVAAGAGALNKTGTGTLILGGANTYTGATNINNGTLTLGANNTLADTTAVTVASGATFNVNGRTDTIGSLAGAGSIALGSGNTLTTGDTSNTVVSGVISGSGNITKVGTGTMTLSGNNTATGTLQINAGTVQIGASNILANTSSLALNGGRLAVGTSLTDTVGNLSLLGSSTIDFLGNTSSLTFTNAARSAGTLTIDNWSGNPFGAGNSQLIFTNAATGFTGGTNVLNEISFTGYGAGAIRLASGEIVPNTGGTIYTYALTGSGNWDVDNNWSDASLPANADPGTFAQNIGDTAIIGSALTGTSTITLTNTRTLGYLTVDSAQNSTVTANNLRFDVNAGTAQLIKNNTGTSTIASGIQLNDALNITRNGTGNLTVSGGISNNSGTNNLTLTDNNLTGGTTISGAITTGAGSVTKNGAGTVVLSGANTYTGGTTVNAGTISVSADNNLGATSGALTLNGGTLNTTASYTTTRTTTLGTAGGTFDTNNATTLTLNGVVSGTGSLTKVDTGTLALGAANTYTGATNINAGTLTTNVANALADTTAVTVASGATYNLNTFSDTIGSISGVSGSAVTLGSGTLTSGGTNASTTFAGVISGSGGIAKAGTGTLTLTGANTFTGATAINAGVVNIQNNTALGTATAGTTVASGAALEVQGGLIAVVENLTLNGTGVSSNGALRNVSGNNTLTGTVALGSATEIQSDAGTLTLTGNITGAAQNLTLDGAGNTTISGIIGTTSGTLTKNGSGYTTLSGANTYTGATAINAGTLEIQNASALGTSAGGTTVLNGATLALSGGITTAETPLTINGAGVGGAGAVRSLSGTNTLSGAITLGGESYIGVDSGSTLTSTGAITGSFGVTKVGTGTLVLNSATANTYTGTTAISAGTLEIQRSNSLGSTNATTIANGSALRLNGSGLSIAENITVTGSGISGAGAIQNSGGNNTLTGLVSMTGNTTVASTSGNTLTVNGAISGTGFNLVKTGDGGLTLGAANTYTGTTTLSNGTLTLAANAPVGANGSLGNASSVVQIGDANTQSGNTLSLLAGTVTGLSIDRQITVSNYGSTVTLGGTNTTGTNTFSGNIGLAKDVTLTAATGGTVAFSGDISGTGGLTKTGTGIVTLSGNNTFSGNNTVSAGTLVAASNNALGNATSSTSVTSGASLALQGGVTIPAGESITLNGTGVSSVGALNSATGSNTVAGTIALGSATTIGSATANTTLTLNGAITGANNLTTTGAGNIALNGANTFSGTYTVGGSAGSETTLGTSASLSNITSLTVNSGNTFSLGADNQINNSANLALAGGTLNVGSFDATFRQLTQSTASTIDYLDDGGLLRFNGVNGSVSGLGTLTGTLTIANWGGSLTGSGTEQLVVYSTSGAPTVTGITFAGWGAATTIARGDLGTGYYEILPSVTATDWNINGSGTWTGTNWNTGSGGNVAGPNAANTIVRLGNTYLGGGLTVDPTITVSSNRTVGTLIFDNAGSKNYTVSGASRLDFTATGGAQIIVNDNGSHVISTAGRYADSTTITNNSSAATGLTISGNLDQRASGTLAVTGTGTTLISGNITQNGGTTNLLKTGTGNLILSNAANAYTGTTTVRNGTLEIDANAPSGANGALGNSATAVIVNDASTTAAMDTALIIGASGVTVGRAITVGSQGATTTLGGGGNFTTGTSTFSGAITLNKGVSLNADGTSTVNFNGQLIDGTGTTNITKTGTGTVVLGNASNNYDGATNIDAGTLRVGVANALPNTSAVTVASGATLDVNALNDSIGSLAGAGNVTLGSPGAATTLTTGGNNGTTTFSGVISGGANAALTKTGTGTMTLTGANTYLGATTVSGGMLVAANNTALGTNAAGTTVNAAATLGLQDNITVTGEQLNLAAATSPSNASLANLSGTNTWTGNISLTGGTANDTVKIDAAGGSQLTLSGVISQATNAKVLYKSGTGTLILSGANTYTGLTNVAGGTLIAANNNALGTTAAGTSVQVGATLGFQNNVTVAVGEGITLNTSASPTAPSLKNIQDNNTVVGNISLSGANNAGVQIDSNTGNLTLNGVISQTGTGAFVTKTGAGTVTLGGTAANTFNGAFSINDGTVVANKTAGQNATGTGAINIGDGTGTANSAILQLGANNQLNDTSGVTINTDGKLDLQANTDTIGALTMSGGSVTGSGTVTLGGNLTFNGVGTSTATISSNVNLGGNRIVQVGNNGITGDTDLTISGVVSGTGNLTKTDLGVLQLSGSSANTYTGTTTITDGTLALNKTAGVQALGAGNVTVGDGAGAASSASLKLLASNQISNTTSVSISSDGKFDVNGQAETIATFTGTGLIDTGGSTGSLIAGGTNASWTFSGSLAGSGSIDKVGTGTLTFDQNIDFSSGTLNLAGGTLALAGINFNVGTIHITGNTTIDFGNSSATILTAANVIVDAGVTLTITNWVNNVDYFYATNNFSNTSGGPNATFDQRGPGYAPQNQITFIPPTYTSDATTWQSYDHQITPAPEPSTYGAIFIGLCSGFIFWRRRRALSKQG